MHIFRLLFCTLPLLFCQPLAAQQVLPIWGDDDPPYFKPHSVVEYEEPCFEVVCVYQVVNPTLTLYLPEGGGNGTAVVILPGGGYETEAVYHEGYEIAQALAQRGTVAAVLKYRLPNPDTSTHPELVPSTDVRQALSLLRERQEELGFNASLFGVLGFSAGGHLAASVSINRSPDTALNPDFSILIYGVSRLVKANQDWLEKTLYHRPMTTEEVANQTLLGRIDGDTPPAFLVHAYDDDVCHFSESTLYAEALKQHGVDTELHLFAKGGHGFGPGRSEDGTDQWLGLAGNWLDRLGAQQKEPSFPGATWELSDPEAEGLDAEAIEQLDTEIRSGKHGFIDSMLITRGGRIVFEAYYDHDYAAINAGRNYPSPPPWDYFDSNEYPWRHGTRLHSLQSTTKSFMSALVGIAIERGDLPGTDVTLGELLPHRNIDDPDKAGIRLENILTMTPGFGWNEWASYFDTANDATAVEQQDDWVAYLLEKPLVAEQGTQYNYNSTNTQLMSEALATATGLQADKYAEEFLFGPIGIDNYYWNNTPEGFSNAGGGLFLEPRDLARFALLFERDGEWNGKQVIPSEWVQRSRTAWVTDIDPEDPDYDMGYGYQWWIYNKAEPGKPEMYGGWGWGGQFPLIVPELGLTAVFTGWNIYEDKTYEHAFRLFYDRVVLSADH